MADRDFFWLHIKKSAGQSTRRLLSPHYVVVEKAKQPANFIQSPPEHYNDILNNYRVVLGSYQVRRALFAKTVLYPETWDDLVSFAFAREPLSRCVSMYHHQWWTGDGRVERARSSVRQALWSRRLALSPHAGFDHFLDYVESTQDNGDSFAPPGLRFIAHTARMWNDVADDDGNVLLSHVFRLESITAGINQVFEECGIQTRLTGTEEKVNRARSHAVYVPTPTQRRRVEQLYARDFELYESAERP